MKTIYSTGRILVFLFALGGLQVATSTPYPGTVEQPINTNNDFHMMQVGPETLNHHAPNQDNKVDVVWKVDSGAAGRTINMVDLPSNKESNKKDEVVLKKDMAIVSEQVGVKLDDVAVTTPSPSGDASATKEKEQESKDGGSGGNEGDKSNQESLGRTILFLDTHHDDMTSADTGDTDDDDVTIQMDRCMRARCTPPPAAHYCKETALENSATVMKGITNECCPIHICNREDGSTYYHYAIEVEDNLSSSQFPQQSSTSPESGGNSEQPARPASPMSLPPLLASLLPPIFPLVPPPPTFYNAGRQGSFFPSQSGGVFQPTASTSSLHIFLPSQSNNARFPTSESSSQQTSPLMQLFSKQTPPVNAPMNVDGSVKNISVGSWGNVPITAKFNSVMSSVVPLAANAFNNEAQRARKNPYAPVFGFDPFNPLPPQGFSPFRPGGVSFPF